jgi:hypothetical protein
MKPTLKPTGTKRLKLQYHVLHSTFAFKIKLRRYTLVESGGYEIRESQGNFLLGFGSPTVGLCRLKPVFASTG